MSEQLAQYIVSLLDGKVASEFIAFIISMLPVLELRGGLVAAKLMDVDFFRAFVICFIGNMLPIPFILFFYKKNIQLS